MRQVVRGLLGLTISLCAAVPGAHAQCTTKGDARLVQRSLARAIRCDDRALRRGPGECTAIAPPACADTLVADAAALGYGPNDPAAAAVDRRVARDALSCQKAIG